ncbi:pentapeptide repeat-containing protein [Nocardia sp. NPDC056541]
MLAEFKGDFSGAKFDGVIFQHAEFSGAVDDSGADFDPIGFPHIKSQS